MPFQLSPGVLVTETDLSGSIPAVASSTGAIAGPFVWGPALSPTLIDSEANLVKTFGKPTSDNARTFFTAANFLAYSGAMYVVRTDSVDGKNAVAAPSGSVNTTVTVSNGGFGYRTGQVNVVIGAPQQAGGLQATATATLDNDGRVQTITITSAGSGYVGDGVLTFTSAAAGGTDAAGSYTVDVGTGAVTSITLTDAGSGYVNPPLITIVGDSGGDGLFTGSSTLGRTVTSITITAAGSGYTSAPSINVVDTSVENTGTGFVGSTSVTAVGVKILNKDIYEDQYINGGGLYGEFAAKYPGTLGNSIAVHVADAGTYAGWTYEDEFDSAPGTSTYSNTLGATSDEMHIVVIDSAGAWTGTPGAILEKFAYISKGSDTKRPDGSAAFYRDVMNNESAYVWWMDHPVAMTNWGETCADVAAAGGAFTNLAGPLQFDLIGGVDDLAYSSAKLQEGYAMYQNAEEIDISLVMTGEARASDAKWVVDNVADYRKDCMAFVSPVGDTGAVLTTSAAMVSYRNNSSFNVNSSYAVLDTGYKYQYDRYNDAYRWIPMNGDIAGLCARTDSTNDPWWSPGGLNRGLIKNAIKLALNPTKAHRDELYKNGINPVVSMPGQGILLFGDKTLLAKPSAFDRINVRRLFIVLEKAIAKAAKFQLFEFNDAFTRARFRSMVTPFLRDVQGRRGVIDFRVKCDETNNTGEVIDRNEFIADIYIKPNRSINFITLNFVALRSGVSFSEVGA